MSENPKFAVIGGGSWATAIAKMLCVNLPEIAWYMRNEDAINHIKAHKHNPNYLSGVEFDLKKLKLTNNINEAIEYADYLIFGYKMVDSVLSVDNLWLMKVWEMAGNSGANPVNMQTKNGQPYNLRPIKWYAKTARNKPFADKVSFLNAIAETLEKYSHSTGSYSENWLKNVKKKYFENTGIKL